MKAQDLKMNEILEFMPEEGKVLIKGTRALIFNSDSLGILYKDLIENLGFERAKSFVIRWGWSCGYNDAVSMKNQFHWDDDLEWISAGPVLHTLEGHTKVIVEEIKINREEKTWLLKGEFVNSSEAEHYLHNFGKSESPVCWHLVGYASGYGTAFLGEPVFYKELTCIGQGEAHCTFIGKTLKDWGEDIESEHSYYEEKKINEELQTAHARIQLQNHQLKQAFTIHKELTDLVLKGEGASGITKTLARIIDGKVFLLNSQRQLTITSDDQNRLEYTLLEFLKTMDDEKNQSVNQKRSIFFQLQNRQLQWSCMLKPVIAGEDILGYLVVARENNGSGFEKDLIMTIERAATVYALEILKQKAVIDLEQKLRGDFVDSLIAPTIFDEKSLIMWGLRLGIDISKPHMMIAIDYEYPPLLQSEEKALLFKNDLLNTTLTFLKRKVSDVLCVNVKEKMINLLPYAEKQEIHQLCNQLKQYHEQRFTGIIISFGIGKPAYKPADYHASYQQALETLEIIGNFAHQERIRFFEDLGSIAMLLETKNKDGLRDYMLRKLGHLLEYDAKYHSELVQSLKCYLDVNSIRKAADQSSVSLSGFKYRLKKIKELGYDLQSLEERFELQLALKILDISK